MRAKILSGLPFDEVFDLVRALLATGLSKEAVAHEVAAFLDEQVDFRTRIKGAVGAAAEAVDEAVFYAVALAVANFAVALLHAKS